MIGRIAAGPVEGTKQDKSLATKAPFFHHGAAPGQFGGGGVGLGEPASSTAMLGPPLPGGHRSNAACGARCVPSATTFTFNPCS